METLKKSILIMVLLTFFSAFAYSQNYQRSYKSNEYPQWYMTGMGGISFPIGNFGENYKSGPTFGVELNMKVNKEVGFFGKVGYSIYPNKTSSSAPDGKYIEYTVGPRYSFNAKNLKSSLFLEAGVGGYSFIQDSYSLNGAEVAEYTSTDFGMNAGFGGILNLGTNVDLLFKAKYHNILTDNGSTSFIEPVLGLDVNF